MSSTTGQPSRLEEHEWAQLCVAFADSAYIQTVLLLKENGNKPLPGKKLFANLNTDYGEEVINAYLHRKKLAFQMKRFEPLRHQGRGDRKFAFVRRSLEKQLELPFKPDLFQRRSGNRP